jgi:hypothetical protein
MLEFFFHFDITEYFVQIVYKKGQLHQFESHFVAQQHFEKGEGV